MTYVGRNIKKICKQFLFRFIKTINQKSKKTFINPGHVQCPTPKINGVNQ